MKELIITKERVLDAASKCSTAKEVLKSLFPVVFEHEDNTIGSPFGIIIKIPEFPSVSRKRHGEPGHDYFVSNSNEIDGVIVLGGKFAWEIKAYNGMQYLIAKKKDA